MQPHRLAGLSGLQRPGAPQSDSRNNIERSQSQQNPVICSDILCQFWATKNLNVNKAIVRWELMLDVSEMWRGETEVTCFANSPLSQQLRPDSNLVLKTLPHRRSELWLGSKEIIPGCCRRVVANNQQGGEKNVKNYQHPLGERFNEERERWWALGSAVY